VTLTRYSPRPDPFDFAASARASIRLHRERHPGTSAIHRRKAWSSWIQPTLAAKRRQMPLNRRTHGPPRTHTTTRLLFPLQPTRATTRRLFPLPRFQNHKCHWEQSPRRRTFHWMTTRRPSRGLRPPSEPRAAYVSGITAKATRTNRAIPWSAIPKGQAGRHEGGFQLVDGGDLFRGRGAIFVRVEDLAPASWASLRRRMPVKVVPSFRSSWRGE